MYLKKEDEYILLDIFRLIMSFLVVMIHTFAFSDINQILYFVLKFCITTLAVPFFFVTTGFFIYNKIYDKDKIKQYLIKTISLYVAYYIISIPLIIANRPGVNIIRDILYFISPFHMWYLNATIVAVILIYFSLNNEKIGLKKIFILSIVLHIFAIIISTYPDTFRNIPIFKAIIDNYIKYFESPRNGFASGLFYILIGIIISKNIEKIKMYNYKLLFVIGMFFMFFEVLLSKILGNVGKSEYYFSIIFGVIFLFLSVINTRINKRFLKLGNYYRKLSVILFGFHYVFIFYLNNLKLKFIVNSVILTLVVIVICLVIGMILIALSNNEKFKILKCMY